MAKYVIGTFLCILVIGTLLGAGCTSSPGKVPGGPQQSVTPTLLSRDSVGLVSLADAIAAMNSDNATGSNASIPLQIRYIRGVDLQPQGLAREWIIGVTRRNESFFFTYTARGGSRVSWPMKLSYRDININQIVTPDTLLQSHRLFIQDVTRNGAVPIAELELIDGIYSLTVGNETNSQLFRYDAVTGKEIQ